MQKGKLPFLRLGSELAMLRQLSKESLAEVSGAVEIDAELLSRFENGELRPSEDILQLLINHFDLEDNQADKLWELSGYNQNDNSVSQSNADDNTITQPSVMLLPIDARIVYTDTVNVTVNNFGVVMNFMQNAGPNNVQLPVARVGMSVDHAKSVIEVMQKTIEQATKNTQPKLLPKPRNSSNKKQK